jgi:Ni/Fe-hydrogenase subunit HybB-like protein
MSNSTTQNKTLLTPFNIVAGAIVVIGLILTFVRFTKGIGAVTNLDNNYPWGIWIGFDLMCGVALAAGGYVTSSAVYLFGMRKFHAAVRPAILTGFLGYLFVIIALLYDLGRPYRLPYPFAVSPGPTSMLFEVGLCVALYFHVLLLEFFPAILEWLGLAKFRNMIHKLTIGLTIFGVVLSTLHQSSLGALFLIAPSKLHPLWYSQYIAVYFFVSSIAAGLSMVIFEGFLSHRYMHDKMDAVHLEETKDIPYAFAKAASLVLMAYFAIKVIGLIADNNWHYLGTPYGYWFLVEMLGFVALPSLLYAVGSREKNLTLIKITSVIAILGIILNRLNVSVICFNWKLPLAQKYIPSLSEIGISVFMVTCIILTYRFIANRMPVLYEHPDFKDSDH